MSDQQEVDRNWSFDVNLSGLRAPTQTKQTEVVEGYYKAEITEMYIRPEKPGRVIIKMAINDGVFSGVIRTDGLNVPKSDTDNVRFYWRGLAESAGYTPAQLDAGQLHLGPSSFVGRTVHIYFVPKSESSQYENITYLPVVAWNQQRQVFEMASRDESSTVRSSGTATLGSTPAGTPGENKTKQSLMDQLGVKLGGGQPLA